MTEIRSALIVGGEPPFERNGAAARLLRACGTEPKWEPDASKKEKENSRWAYFVKKADQMWDAAQICDTAGGAVFCPFNGGCVVSDTAGGSALILPVYMALPADIFKKERGPVPPAEAVLSGAPEYREERLRLIFLTAAILRFCSKEKISLLAAADKARRAIRNL